MKAYILSFLLAILAHATLAADDIRKAEGDALKLQEDEIREVVFRYQIASHKSNLYFLGLNIDKEKPSIDPDQEFMKRFKDLKVIIRKRSDARSGVSNVPTDPVSGKTGLSLSVGRVKWISDKEVEVHGSVFGAELNAAGYDYLLKRSKGRWTVVASGLSWVS